MQIICKTTSFTDLSEELRRTERLERLAYNHKSELVGRRYVVYAIFYHNGSLFFVIDWRCPYTLPALFCEVEDGRLSKYFEFSQVIEKSGRGEERVRYTIGFPEIVRDPLFFARIVDHDPEAQQVFRHYQKLLVFEFPDPNVRDVGIQLQENWVQCFRCRDAWESEWVPGMIQCPKCEAVMRNPLYRDCTRVQSFKM
jgi:hypothetical protein